MKKAYALFFSLMMILATVTISMTATTGAAEARGRRHNQYRHNPYGHNRYNNNRHHNRYNNPYNYNQNRHRRHRDNRRGHNRVHKKIWRYIRLYNQYVRGYGPYNNTEYRPQYHHLPNCHNGYCTQGQQCGWVYLPNMGGWYFLCN